MDLDLDLNLETFEKFVAYIRYLVIFPDNTCKVYNTLKEISHDICIGHTTVSKCLTDSKTDSCYCYSKITNFRFLIHKLRIPLPKMSIPSQ
uniref:Uncharacterized protein n=1 Tax=viral metagenome TaxID=1070528 RepID=A0A6C0KI97_9ZZZZ